MGLQSLVVHYDVQFAACLPIVKVEHARRCLGNAEVQAPVPEVCGQGGHVCCEHCFNLFPSLVPK